MMINYGRNQSSTPPPRIEYRYIPRNFETEQYLQTPILDTYGKLFTDASPWEESMGYPGIFMNKKEDF